MNKKRIFGIVVFVILGLFMFTFANPLNEKGDDNQPKEASGSKTIANNDSKDVTNNTPASNNNTANTQTNNNNGNTRNVNRNVNNQTGTLNGPVQNNEQSNVQPAAPEAPVAPVAPVEPVEPKPEPVQPKPEVEPVQPVQPVEPVKPVEPEKPEREEPIVPKPVDLTIDKLNAIQELKDYRKSYEFTDDTEYKDTIEEYSRAINDAESFIDIKNALNEGKKAIDELINKDLEAYRDAAKKEIKDYADSLLLVTDVTELLDGYYDDIDEATTKSAIDKIVEAAKAKLDEIAASELQDAKDKAKDYIDKYKAEDEEYVDGIRPAKIDIIDDIDKATTKESVGVIAKEGKEEIDDILANKKFTVVFKGIKGQVLSTETVTYKSAVKRPDTSKTIKEWNNSIVLKFDKWNVTDDELNSVKSDLTVQARYTVVSATTKISILKEDIGKTYSTDIKDFNHPYNHYFNLTITKEIEDAINNYRDTHIFVYQDNDELIRSVVQGEDDVYENNKYKKLQYYVLKLQGDRFHCDARVIYDKEAELADAKTAAINEINNYKTVETNDISEVKDEKIKAIDAIEKMTSVEDIKNKVQPTKDAIDKIIANKTYDVTFVGKTSSQTVKVGYNKDAVAPTTKEFTNPVYRNVTYKFTGWDNSLKNIKANTTITASYEIEKVVATVFLINEDCNIPEDRSSNLAWSCYKNFKTIELKVTKEIKEAIANDKKATVFTSDEAIRAVDKNSSLPTKDGKYKTYEFYVMKFIEDSYAGFHIDGKMFYDKDAEELDLAKEKLRKLIKDAKELSTTGKTNASIEKLNGDITTAERVVEGSNLADINASISALSNIKLENIKILEVKVKDNKNGYYVQGQKLNITVTYTDNNGNKDKETTNYEIHYVTPHRAYVTVDGTKSEEFEFTVVAKAVEEITKVVNNKDVYYQNDNLDIIVTARFNDGEVRTLRQDEYTTNFTKKNPGKDIKGTVVATSNEKATKEFTYNVSKYNSKAEEDAAIAAEQEAKREEERLKAIKKVDVKVSDLKDGLYIEFHKIPEGATVSKVYRKGRVLTYNIGLGNTTTTPAGKIRYEVNLFDHGILRETNTSLVGQYIYVQFSYEGKTYVSHYTEKKGNLTFKGVERI